MSAQLPTARMQILTQLVERARQLETREATQCASLRLALRNACHAHDIVARSDDPRVIEARHMLHQAYSRREVPPEIVHEVEQFFSVVSRQIMRSPDPVAALSEFFAQRRGAKRKHGERDFLLAVAMTKRIQGGDKYEAALCEVAGEFGVKKSVVQNAFANADKEERAFKFALKHGAKLL